MNNTITQLDNHKNIVELIKIISRFITGTIYISDFYAVEGGGGVKNKREATLLTK